MQTKATIRDIAELSGVSVTTVSHVLNEVPGKRIAASTRAKVRDAADRLAYTPNRLAQGLRLQRSNTIGMISDRVLTTPYATEMIHGAQDAAAAAGSLLMLVSSGGDLGYEVTQAQALIDRQVDGLVYASMHHRNVQAPDYMRLRPTVLLDAVTADQRLPSVVPDEIGGALAAMAELIGHGHTRIGFLCDNTDVPAVGARTQGYRMSLEEAGLPYDPSLVVHFSTNDEAPFRPAARLLRRPDRPTALFCYTDRIALGVYFAAQDAGLSIPEDLSVVGFDDMQLISAGVRPELTTVALPHYAMGHWSITHLLSLIDGEPAPEGVAAPHVQLPCPLVRRASVGSPSRD